MRKAGGWKSLGLSLLLSLCLSLFLCLLLRLPASLCLSQPLLVSLCFSASFSISLPLSVSLSPSVLLCLPVSVCLSLRVCLSLPLLELGHYHLFPSRLCPWTEHTASFPGSPACRRQADCVLSLFLRSISSVNAKPLQSCLTPGDPVDFSPPGFSVRGILQARTVEWVAMPSSTGPS